MKILIWNNLRVWKSAESSNKSENKDSWWFRIIARGLAFLGCHFGWARRSFLLCWGFDCRSMGSNSITLYWKVCLFKTLESHRILRDINLIWNYFSKSLHNINNWTIQLGITRRNSHTYYGQKVKVQRVIPHPQYNLDVMHDNDIALFQVYRKLVDSSFLILLSSVVRKQNCNLADLLCTNFCMTWHSLKDTVGRISLVMIN